MNRIAVLPAALLVWQVLAAAPATAQLGEYTPPGTTADRPGDDKERIENQMEEARWDAGPFRLDPWIGITNAAFVTNAFTTSTEQEQESDFTMTLGAGILGVVPFGQKAFLTFDAVPQYVFWLEQDDRNTHNQSFGARLHGFYNSLYLETGAARRDQVRVVSSEFDQPTNTRRDSVDGLAELRLGGSFHIFGSAILGERTSLEDEEDPRLATFSAQDREETVLRAGLRYRPRENVLVGLGLESSDTEFLNPEKDLSNTGEYPFAELMYDAPKFFATGEVVLLDLEPEGELSQFVALDETQWRLQLTFDHGWRMTYSLYGRQDFQYALGEGYSHFANSRFGGKVQATLSERWTGSLFLEAGTDDYEGQSADVAQREDDVTSWGIRFAVDLSSRFALAVGYSLTEFDSSIPERDRDNGRLTINLGMRGLILGQR